MATVQSVCASKSRHVVDQPKQAIPHESFFSQATHLTSCQTSDGVAAALVSDSSVSCLKAAVHEEHCQHLGRAQTNLGGTDRDCQDARTLNRYGESVQASWHYRFF